MECNGGESSCASITNKICCFWLVNMANSFYKGGCPYSCPEIPVWYVTGDAVDDTDRHVIRAKLTFLHSNTFD